MHKAGQSMRGIAIAIGKSPSSVSREMLRNADRRSGVYRADLAQRKCGRRKDTRPHAAVFTDEMKEHVRGLLMQKYSPEQVVGHAERSGPACVSHETIYCHVWKDRRSEERRVG